MTDLIEKTPNLMLPLRIHKTLLSGFDTHHITTLIPRKGREKAASEALKKAHGCDFPTPGRISATDENVAIWSGLGQAFLVGKPPAKILGRNMTLVDQSDGWTAMLFSGLMVRDVLARLCPLDLRESVFEMGHTARSLIAHIPASISFTAPDAFLILVFQSMAECATHEITEAMKSVAAQDQSR